MAVSGFICIFSQMQHHTQMQIANRRPKNGTVLKHQSQSNAPKHGDETLDLRTISARVWDILQSVSDLSLSSLGKL